MPLREDILTPIPGDNPSGENLYYHPLTAKIKEARRQEDAAPQGEWEREIKEADYAEVIKLAEEAVATKSKDLQLAVWLAEALTYKRSFAGLHDALELIRGLIENFWETLYPELEDGDAELRAAPLEWLGNYFDPGKGSSPAMAVKRVPITRNGQDSFKYKESRVVPNQVLAESSESKMEARNAAVADGKLTPEDFDLAFKETPKTFYRSLDADLKAAKESLSALDGACGEKFGRDGPGFSALRDALEEVGATVRILLQEKLKLDPDPVAPVERAEGEPEGEVAADAVAVDGGEDLGDLPAGAELRTRQDAVRFVVAAARFLRRSEPDSPVSYLMLRALRWGELRANNGELTPGVLTAPSTETRMALRNHASGGDWARVLETAEAVAATGSGRGWLDLHRYAIRACDELGYGSAAKSLRSELRALLMDYPQLTSMTLTDDTGTANPETLAWLSQEGLLTLTQPS